MSHSPASLIEDVQVQQGWGIFESNGQLELQRIDPVALDEQPIFQNDYEAWLFVWKQAKAGDAVCGQALERLQNESHEEYSQISDYCTQMEQESHENA